MDKQMFCPFCHLQRDVIQLGQNYLARAIFDSYPVTALHTLIIPKRHTESYFDLRRCEVEACNDLLHVLKEAMLAQDPQIKGFNIGVNQGEVAGQTIFHTHIHLIPRRAGDVDNPRGGIRNAIQKGGW